MARWSNERKARTRRNNVRKRIEKKHGYNPNSPQLTIFEETRQQAINAEVTAEVETNIPYYFDGKDPDLSHLPQPGFDTYSSRRLYEDEEYRRHWEKKLNRKLW